MKFGTRGVIVGFVLLLLTGCQTEATEEPVLTPTPTVTATALNALNGEARQLSTLVGKKVCLAHRDPAHEHERPCKVGLETVDGEFYGIEVDEQLAGLLESGDIYRVTGQIISAVDDHDVNDFVIVVESVEVVSE